MNTAGRGVWGLGRGRRGIALVLTLAVLSIMTALTVEFVYSVRVNVGFMDNWRRTQELSLAVRSGAAIATRLILNELDRHNYSYPGRMDIPPVSPFMDNTVAVALSIEDEDAKFKLTTLVHENGTRDDEAYEAFVRLLHALEIEDELADRIADWMDKDQVAARTESETDVKNAAMDSIEELLDIPGVDRAIYDKLKPYVTVLGSGKVNINGAQAPVLMALADGIDEEMAGRVISYREEQPFEQTADISKVAGFESIGIGLIGQISVKGTVFSLTVQAASPDGVRSTLECAFDSSGKVKYWREL